MARTAIIAGASGLVGGKLLDVLLQRPEYAEVLIIVRKKLKVSDSKLKQLIVNFDNLDEYQSELKGDTLFCCLGTTRRKTPGDDDYRKIDHDYPLNLAKISLKNKINCFHLVSSMGADPLSAFFYTKLKGEVEADISKINIPCLQIYRPSALTGNRNESRLAESIFTGLMKVIDPLLLGGLKKYRSIPAQTVAMAMFKQSLKNEEGVFIHSSDEIKNLA